MAPFDLFDLLGSFGGLLAYVGIGFGFGYILEASGFGDSRRLAGQFYFRELAVVRVMFTTIVTAMLLVFSASAFGLLDYEDVWVNPTFLVPGIVGGLVMGVGFIIGGYCPGTSLAAAATGKIDALFFVAGALFGMFVFGESADGFAAFMMTTDWGRYTLPELFGLPTGIVVVGVVALAVGMFGFMDILHRTLWKADDPGSFTLGDRSIHPAVLALPAFGLASLIAVVGQPDLEAKWALRASEYQARLDTRAVYIDPGELLHYMHDDAVDLKIVDVRDESSYNLFHLQDAVHLGPGELDSLWGVDEEKPNRLFVVVSNDERAATEAWKDLTTMKVPNVYILEGGINGWLDRYREGGAKCDPIALVGDEPLEHTFDAAIGDRHPSSRPSHHDLEHDREVHAWVEKVELQVKARKGGGCG